MCTYFRTCISSYLRRKQSKRSGKGRRTHLIRSDSYENYNVLTVTEYINSAEVNPWFSKQGSGVIFVLSSLKVSKISIGTEISCNKLCYTFYNLMLTGYGECKTFFVMLTTSWMRTQFFQKSQWAGSFPHRFLEQHRAPVSYPKLSSTILGDT